MKVIQDPLSYLSVFSTKNLVAYTQPFLRSAVFQFTLQKYQPDFVVVKTKLSNFHFPTAVPGFFRLNQLLFSSYSQSSRESCFSSIAISQASFPSSDASSRTQLTLESFANTPLFSPLPSIRPADRSASILYFATLPRFSYEHLNFPPIKTINSILHVASPRSIQCVNQTVGFFLKANS